MKAWWIVTKKELAGYFRTPIAFIFIVAFLTSANWFFLQNFFLVNQATLRGWFEMLPWFLLFLVPALTMRLWAEEKKSGTIETLLTLPLADSAAVMGKFAGSLLFYLVCLACSLPLVGVIGQLGQLDTGQVIGQYLGAMFLGAAMISLGLFISSLTANQIIAFIGTLGSGFLLLTLNSQALANFLPLKWRALLPYLSFFQHYNQMAKGLIDLRDVVFFLSVTLIFLYANVKSLESRFWQV